MKYSRKLLALLLVFAMAVSVGALSFGSSAVEDYTPDESIKRVCLVFNGDSDTQRAVSWATPASAGSNAQVMLKSAYNGVFTPAKTYDGEEKLFQDNYQHKVVIDGLQPSTEYLYRVGDAEKNSWSVTGSFTTDSTVDEPFTFVTIADVQASTHENFEKSAKTLNAAMDKAGNAEFIVNLGDFVNDCTNDEWDWFFEENEDILTNTSFAPVAGNHDGNLKWNWFYSLFALDSHESSADITGSYYSFDYGDAHFSVLNTNDMYPMSQEQLNWLRNDMNASDATWKFVLMHRALYSAGKNINKPDTVIMRDRLLPVIDELGIDVVFAGHDHMYLRTVPVQNDAPTETTYIEEMYNGEMTTFALNPKGTFHVLPNTAGTKRYKVNEGAMDPILDVAQVAVQPGMPCYATVTIDGENLIYKAYAYDIDGDLSSTLVDEFAIKRTTGRGNVDNKEYPTGHLINLLANIKSFCIAVPLMLYRYIELLIQTIKTKVWAV